MTHVAIIGAGFTGLAAAYRLRRAGWQVTVYEAREQAGGLAGGFRAAGWSWSLEYFYHHWFASDRVLLGWLQELGWAHRVVFRRPVTVVYHAGRFYPFDSPQALLRFPGLNWPDKFRLGLVTLYLRLNPRWQPLERVTAHEWLRRALGPRAYHRLWEPLLEGKFGPYYQQVNMAWFWARIRTRTPRLGTFEGGFQALADALVERLTREGVRFAFRAPVRLLEPDQEGGWRVHTEGEAHRYDRVLVTLGPAWLRRMLPEDLVGASWPWESLPHLGAVTLVLALDRPFRPEGFYWYNIPKREGFPFLILVEHTHFVPPEHFGGEHIVYVGDYVPPGHPYLGMGAEELLHHLLPGLQRIQPAFRTSWVRRLWRFATEYAQPVPLRYHSRQLPPLKLPWPGLYWASMSHVYPWDRGTNYAVALGFRVARRMLEEAA